MIKVGKKLFIILLLFAFTSTTFFASHNYASASIFEWNKKETSKNFAALSGFKPDTVVSYKITPQGSDPIINNGIVDKKGFLNIELPQDLDKNGPEITYDFTLDEEDKTVSLQIHLNTKNNTASVSGEGTDAFADIEITADNQNILTRSDWSGLFEETGIRMHNEQRDIFPVQVALYSRNGAGDAQNRLSPALIKVQAVPSVLAGGNRQADITRNYIEPMMHMAEQLTLIMMFPMPVIGMFFDAKTQLETQRTQQALKAEAVKDYHPSQQMCRIGSYIKSLPNAEIKIRHDHLALSEALLSKYTNEQNMGTYLGAEMDLDTRLEQYKRKYCDASDNDSGLDILCDYDGATPTPPGAIAQLRVNKDVDFGRTVEYPYTMDINFTDGAMTDEEEDVIALARNLYWSKSFSDVDYEELNQRSRYYKQSRELIALAGLAHNSFAKLVAMKARSPAPTPGIDPGWAHMKTMLREFGLIDADIDALVGEHPSYYAQMDILTKKLYQNPNFFTNLYDKPVNVDRINTSLEAIRIMQMRDHYEASLRREMLLSGLVENQLYTDAEKLQGILLDLKP